MESYTVEIQDTGRIRVVSVLARSAHHAMEVAAQHCGISFRVNGEDFKITSLGLRREKS